MDTAKQGALPERQDPVTLCHSGQQVDGPVSSAVRAGKGGVKADEKPLRQKLAASSSSPHRSEFHAERVKHIAGSGQARQESFCSWLPLFQSLMPVLSQLFPI